MKVETWHIAAVGLAGATMVSLASLLLGVRAYRAVRKKIGDQAAHVATSMGHKMEPQ